MIQRVYSQVMKAGLDKVLVATDDKRIFEHVTDFGGEVVMTAESHVNGTERCAEVIEKRDTEYDITINIQGDEPFIYPEQVSQLRELMAVDGCKIGTLVKVIKSEGELSDSNTTPKVEINVRGEALCFSRAVIPFIQGVERGEWLKHHTFYKHIGIYGFKTKTLLELVDLQPSKNEIAESLEQLRWLDNGYTIKVATTDLESPSVDSEDDLSHVRELAGMA